MLDFLLDMVAALSQHWPISIGNLEIRQSLFYKEISEDCLGFCWCQKLEQNLSIAIATRRTVNISWFLIGFWEKLKKLLLSRFAIILKMKDIVDWILCKTPLQIHYSYMKVNNLSKSPSLALFFIWKLCWTFLLKVVSTIFLLICL